MWPRQPNLGSVQTFDNEGCHIDARGPMRPLSRLSDVCCFCPRREPVRKIGICASGTSAPGRPEPRGRAAYRGDASCTDVRSHGSAPAPKTPIHHEVGPRTIAQAARREASLASCARGHPRAVPWTGCCVRTIIPVPQQGRHHGSRRLATEPRPRTVRGGIP